MGTSKQKADQQKHNRVAIYVRVSTDYQIDKDSLPMQRKDLVSYCALILNTDDYVIYEDAGYSGKNTDRPAFQSMMGRIRLGEFTHLLVWKIDRISRNLLDFAAMYTELKRLGVTFVSKNEQFDTSTAMGEAMLKIILVFAELERNMTSERVQATMISRAKSGQWNGGPVPYGYDYDETTQTFSINPERAAVVRRIFDEYEETGSTTMVMRSLSTSGIRKQNGGMWDTGMLSKTLRNKFYIGDYEYNKKSVTTGQTVQLDESHWVVVRDHHPPIISREQYARVSALLDSHRLFGEEDHRDYKTRNVHVFGGLLYCGKCGRMLYSHSSKGSKSPRSRYFCVNRRNRTCEQKNATDYRVGNFVLNFILNILYARDNPDTLLSTADVRSVLLEGKWFREITNVNEEPLDALLCAIHGGEEVEDIFAPGSFIKPRKQPDTALLRQKVQRAESAMERLTELYLFSSESMTQDEYISRKKDLQSQIDEAQAQIDEISSERDDIMPDDEFIQKASEFVMTQELSGQRFVSFQPLSERVAPEVLYDFFHRIVVRITVCGPHITELKLRNGMDFLFSYEDAPQE